MEIYIYFCRSTANELNYFDEPSVNIVTDEILRSSFWLHLSDFIWIFLIFRNNTFIDNMFVDNLLGYLSGV
jgi:hypothetical protein